jgi:DNA-directed RNA polymerase specialized sigma24 family protein
MGDFSLADVDVEEVLYRLTRYAQHLTGAFRFTGADPADLAFPGGESPEDLAMTTLERFFDPADTTLTWDERRGRPTTAGVIHLLKKALEHDFLDLLKSKRYRTTEYRSTHEDDQQEELTLDQLAVFLETPEGLLLKQQRIEWIINQFADDPEAQELVCLQLHPDGYAGFSNQELAELLATTVREIENRKKRIKNRLLKLVASREAGAVANV